MYHRSARACEKGQKKWDYDRPNVTNYTFNKIIIYPSAAMTIIGWLIDNNCHPTDDRTEDAHNL